MKSLTPTIIKSLVFILVTVVATAVLAATVRNTGTGGASYTAMFTDVTSLNRGDDVRMAGVRIGRVDDISIVDHRLAEVRFEVDPAVRINTGTLAQLRFRNLVGQRYLSLQQGDGATTMQPGATFDLRHTQPALNLTALFNGFEPLFRLLSPKDVNALSAQIVQVFQGEGSTVTSLLQSTSQLTRTVAAKDQVIGEVIDNLNAVLATVNGRGAELTQTIDTLQRLVSGLAEDRRTIGTTIAGFGRLTTSVSSLLQQGRAPLKHSVAALGALSATLAAQEPTLDAFLANLPIKLDQIGRLGSYGSWLNFYACSIDGNIPQPEGYVGDVGVQPVAARCTG